MSDTPIQTAFNDAIAAIRERDARIAELEAALRKSRVFVKVMNPTGGNLARAQVALLERIDKLLSKGE